MNRQMTEYFTRPAVALLFMIAGCASQPQSVSPPKVSSVPAPVHEEALLTVEPAANALVHEPKPASQKPSFHETEVRPPIEPDPSTINAE